MKKKIALLALLGGVLYIVWEWWQGMESPCGCSGGSASNMIATGNSNLNLSAYNSLIDYQIQAAKGVANETENNSTLESLVLTNKVGFVSVKEFTSEDGAKETALFYIDNNQQKHRILTTIV
jgi:hypothetical protein